VNCVTTEPKGVTIEEAMLQINSQGVARSQSGTRQEPHPLNGEGETVSDVSPMSGPMMPTKYRKFTDQMALGRFLTDQYHIRTPNELSSCEVCHR
jgi:hypothetical protein